MNGDVGGQPAPARNEAKRPPRAGLRLLAALVLGGLIGSYTLDYSWLYTPALGIPSTPTSQVDALIVSAVFVLSVGLSVVIDRRMPHRVWASAMAVFGVLPLLLMPAFVTLLITTLDPSQGLSVMVGVAVSIGSWAAFVASGRGFAEGAACALFAWIGVGVHNIPLARLAPNYQECDCINLPITVYVYLLLGFLPAMAGGYLGALLRRGLMRLAITVGD